MTGSNQRGSRTPVSASRAALGCGFASGIVVALFVAAALLVDPTLSDAERLLKLAVVAGVLGTFAAVIIGALGRTE